MDFKKDTLINGIAYSAVAIGCVVATSANSHWLEYVCKPAMMLILSSWFFFNSRRYGDRFTLMIQGGLFFSLIGDIALLFQHMDEFNFMIGLAAFLLAHLCYSIAFLRNISEVGGTDGLVLGSSIALLFALFAVYFSWELAPRLDEGLMIPVIAYVVAISCMGILAAFRYTRTFPRSFWMVLVGAVLFIVSDSLLATNRFLRPLSWGPTAVTITYALAQFMIAAGCLLHVLDPDTIRRRQALEA